MDRKDDFQKILFETTDRVAKIVLNHPETLNAMSVEMENEIITALEICNSDKNIRAIVLTGAGRAFSSGGDIRKMVEGVDMTTGKDWAELGGRVCSAVMTLPKPVVAAVNGVAAGGGMGLALACDMVIASEKAFFIGSFTKVGLIPDTGVHFILPRLVGYRKAMELILTAESVDARTALRMGMINSVTDPEDLMPASMSKALSLAQGPTLAYGVAKEILRKSFSSDLHQILELETLGQSILFSSDDHKEGVMAFREKRLPNFTGR